MVFSTQPARRRGAALIMTAGLLSGVAYAYADDAKPAADGPARKGDAQKPADKPDARKLRDALPDDVAKKYLKKFEEAAKSGDEKKLLGVMEEFRREVRRPAPAFRAAPFAGGLGGALPAEMLEKMLGGVDDPAARQALADALEQMKAAPGFFMVPGGGLPPEFGGLFGGANAFGAAANRPVLGVEIAPVSEELAASLKLPAGQGVLVANVLPESAAAKAGVRVDDVIVKLDGETVAGPADLIKKVAAAAKAGKATLVVTRDNEEKTLPVDLSRPKPDPRMLLPEGAAAGDDVAFQSMQVQVTDGDFTVSAKSGDASYTVTGRQAEGGVEGVKIAVKDGRGEEKTGRSAADFDEKYRPAIKSLLKRVGGK